MAEKWPIWSFCYLKFGYFLNLVTLIQGGAGGDGGNGMSGASHLGEIPANPATPTEVVQRGPQVDYRRGCSNHCGGHCEACDEYWYHALDIDLPTQICGGNGGNGGNGGDGGPAGALTVVGESGIEAINTPLASSGGLAGAGAAGAAGFVIKRHFTGYR